jgi:hypothetical protein
MNVKKIFLQLCEKHKNGTVRKRISNVGFSYCLYDKNGSPLIYITSKQFETMLELFDFNLQTGYYTLKPTK